MGLGGAPFSGFPLFSVGLAGNSPRRVTPFFASHVGAASAAHGLRSSTCGRLKSPLHGKEEGRPPGAEAGFRGARLRAAVAGRVCKPGRGKFPANPTQNNGKPPSNGSSTRLLTRSTPAPQTSAPMPSAAPPMASAAPPVASATPPMASATPPMASAAAPVASAAPPVASAASPMPPAARPMPRARHPMPSAASASTPLGEAVLISAQHLPPYTPPGP
mgnify:CR=1 FL=1